MQQQPIKLIFSMTTRFKSQNSGQGGSPNPWQGDFIINPSKMQHRNTSGISRHFSGKFYSRSDIKSAVESKGIIHLPIRKHFILSL